MGDRCAAGNLAAELDGGVSLVVSGWSPVEANERTHQQHHARPERDCSVRVACRAEFGYQVQLRDAMPASVTSSVPHGSRSRQLVWLLGAFASVALVALVLGCVLAFPRWLSPPPTGTDLERLSPKERLDVIRDQRKLENDIRTALLGGLAGLGIIVGSTVGWQQLRHSRWQFAETIRQGHQQLEQSRQAQTTERFTRAIDQLGSDRLEIMLGGIYTLERIAIDAPDDYMTAIAEVLTAYIRTHAPRLPTRSDEGEDDEQSVKPLQERAPAVHTALRVLGRGGFAEVRLDLASTDLHHADLHGLNFRGANFEHADLGFSDFQHSNLQDSTLWNANLWEGRFEGANLRGANLSGAVLHDADLKEADLREANLEYAFVNSRIDWPKGFDWRGAGVQIVDRFGSGSAISSEALATEETGTASSSSNQTSHEEPTTRKPDAAPSQ
jgi:hypothetical protein